MPKVLWWMIKVSVKLTIAPFKNFECEVPGAGVRKFATPMRKAQNPKPLFGAKSEVRQSRERMRWCGLMVWGRQIETQMCNSILQHSQLKMPGGGCWVTTGQFSSSLLSPQLFSWLQISEPRRKQFPLVQWNLHSVRWGNKRHVTFLSKNNKHLVVWSCTLKWGKAWC